MKGIKYVSFFDGGGYDHAARAYMNGLMRAGIPLTWQPLVPGQRAARGFAYGPYPGKKLGKPPLADACNAAIDYETVILHVVPEYYPRLAAKEKGKQVIGYTVWETDRLPRHWPELLDKVDRVLVPCRFNKEVFELCGVTKPIHVIPHIAAQGGSSAEPLPPEIGGGDFVFYTMGPWTARKAVWNTVRSYLNAFTSRDRTLLLVKTERWDMTKPRIFRRFFSVRLAVAKLMKEYPDPARVFVMAERISEEGMAALHGRGDCYVSLCCSEGWGLAAFDAASAGNPVIITGFGGQLDYLPPELSYLAKFRMVSVRDKRAPRSYSPDQKWAEPDLSDASGLMRHVYENRDEAKQKGARLGEYVRETFGEKRIIERLIRALTG